MNDLLQEFPGIHSLDDLFRTAYVFVFSKIPSHSFIRMDIERWRKDRHCPPYLRVFLEKQGL